MPSHSSNLFIEYWPFFNLAIGTIGLLFTLPSLFKKSSLFWFIPLFLYLIHTFEEHGIDLMGRRFAFQAGFCETLKKVSGSSGECAASEIVLCFVNCGTVVIAMASAGLFRHSDSFHGVKAAACGALLVNGISHITKSITDSEYGPGLLTSVVFFIPCSISLIIHECRKNGIVSVLLYSLLMGIIIHVVLFSSLVLAMKGVIDFSLLPAIQILNGFIPLIFTILQGEGNSLFEKKTKIN